MKKVIIGLSAILVTAFLVIMVANAQSSSEKTKKAESEMKSDCANCPSVGECSNCDPAKCVEGKCDPANCKIENCKNPACKSAAEKVAAQKMQCPTTAACGGCAMK